MSKFQTISIAWNCMLLAWLICIIGELLILFVTVKSVLVTGPILLVFGILVVVFARRVEWWLALGLGAAHVGIVLLLFGLVQAFSWGPRQAEFPFATLGALHVLGVSAAMLFAHRNRPAKFAADQCQTCGYLLYGLPEPRCPECGTTFNPQIDLTSPPGSRAIG